MHYKWSETLCCSSHEEVVYIFISAEFEKTCFDEENEGEVILYEF